MITLKKTPAFIRDKIRQKLKLRRIWQRTRHPEDKNKLNRATDELKRTLREDKDNRHQYYLSKLWTSLSTNYSRRIDEPNYTQATYKKKQQHMGEIKQRKSRHSCWTLQNIIYWWHGQRQCWASKTNHQLKLCN